MKVREKKITLDKNLRIFYEKNPVWYESYLLGVC